MKEWILEKITLKIAKNKKYEVAVLPVGSTEPHNFHLPYGCDSFLCEAMAKEVCEKSHKMGAKVILLPIIPYGVDSNFFYGVDSNFFSSFPLTMHMSPSTHLAIVSDIVRSLEAHHIHKLILFNGHGGNDFQFIARELYGKTSVFITVVEWWKISSDKIFGNNVGHAGEMETSLALEFFPDLVHLDDADDGDGRIKSSFSNFVKAMENWGFIVRPWHLLTKNSGNGDPRRASKEKAEKYLSIIVEKLSKFIYELSEKPLDDIFK